MRVAGPDDVDAMTEILVEGLGAKLHPAFGASAAEAVRAMIGHEVAHPDPAYRVATDASGVVGVVHLDIGVVRSPSLLSAIRRRVGWLVAARATVVLAALGPPVPRRDEAVIEELAVRPDARRRGVARALIERCENDARDLRRRMLILQVTLDNAPALGLYRELGFGTRSRQRWRLRRRLFGSPGAMIMEKSVD